MSSSTSSVASFSSASSETMVTFGLFQGCSSPLPNTVYTTASAVRNAAAELRMILHCSLVCYKKESLQQRYTGSDTKEAVDCNAELYNILVNVKDRYWSCIPKAVWNSINLITCRNYQNMFITPFNWTTAYNTPMHLWWTTSFSQPRIITPVVTFTL